MRKEEGAETNDEVDEGGAKGNKKEQVETMVETTVKQIVTWPRAAVQEKEFPWGQTPTTAYRARQETVRSVRGKRDVGPNAAHRRIRQKIRRLRGET
ncbi:uncharacterized protein SPSK_10817 [Sporothrix schenckii 1099-18]|uniref:Uncharacterized protein n=1 Tax=Sporothrix schenckii 1099-18 TaxID=1397361 RepID=A0A0F2MH60_SPOSC|nr:uncharacterized protein SPSK_10817 [Sporothrix schenckii 1099-18]KJR88952.1 hypothetical protein SPSK_10817 [Sporothrix schenckii 1099-18]